MQNTQILFAILLLAPLAGFLFNGLRFKSKNYLLAGSVATGAAAISFICSILLVLQVTGEVHEGEVSKQVVANFFEWLNVGGFRAGASFVVDHISAIMILIITGVGTLIHLFSVGYMSHDERPTKYFAYLNLFLFNMLLLVLGDNLLVMFVGWEGVGLCSYLLIGFWFSDQAKAAAGMKAFVTNRIGDAGFLLGIFMLYLTFGSVHFGEIIARAPLVAEIGWSGPITLACLFLFVGACGKSAQIPLYVWLPDAMAGPTPVSALIHAATMVTAGVYMIVRLHPVFLVAPNALHVIAIVGALTAVFAATIGIVQNDIKKILAYSTVSQLGYMFLACGVGAFNAAMFHLMTHAFFKALMFLGAGSVIHAMHEEQDIRKMGGLKKYMPITYVTFVIGWLAIIGLPPFAGFFSKDEILWQAMSSPLGSPSLYLAGLFAAGCTAFYMTRLMALTFWGKSRFGHDVHPHESPPSMTIPLIVLAVLSAIGGWLGFPAAFHLPNFLEHWFEGSIKMFTPNEDMASLEVGFMIISVMVAALMAFIAYQIYINKPKVAEDLSRKFSGLYNLVHDKYRIDELYEASIIKPLIDASRGLWAHVDVNFIDKITYVVGDAVRGTGSTLKTLQNGNLQQYALYISLGVAVFIFYIMRS
jgi:NADH-quinone oxidoreductase subunit L